MTHETQPRNFESTLDKQLHRTEMARVAQLHDGIPWFVLISSSSSYSVIKVLVTERRLWVPSVPGPE